MEEVFTKLTDRARCLYQASEAAIPHRPRRVLIALAGPPGSGKSTIAAEVVKRLNASSSTGDYAVVLPMDGFHLARAELSAMDCSTEAHARRGVFWTYDAQGVCDLIRALHDTRYNLDHIHTAPSFDHATKDPVLDSIKIHPDIRLMIVEGNWLLYDDEPWRMISTMVDDTWFVDVDEELALQRVATRHLESGIESTWCDAVRRASSNDLVNGHLVRDRLVDPMIRVQSVDDDRRSLTQVALTR